ncbi:MAG: FtsW/RodA/SpoVE family cell cycle protein [Leptolyngbyaceae cyanobacterium SM1_1_3]|nr:FtsW/RodA/SpoVE family cell cycle protein [Leptolyngbyaceae cyanobacterium SM1_1_3]NJN02322.1 FtsW/RodA/SpoVE family cell cycle protein [Leptolyngbyaceae cyanobacterium RM1_1_2]NJO10620.1 FtsW/RodA/SpoVE family cell cycle protein [Leptolyngbyaceae cyanobacterium SL_1_1]
MTLTAFLNLSAQTWSREARLLRWLTLLWLIIGLAVLYSASYPVADADYGDGLRYFKIQLLWVALGLIGFQFVVQTSLQRLLKISGIVLLLLVSLILVTLMPQLGVTVNGATRWLALGPFLIQPSELLKPFLVLQAARLFGQWPQIPWVNRCLWLSIFAAVVGVILLQPNLSTAAVCGITLWLIALAAGLPYAALAVVAGSGLGLALVSVSLKAYQRQRIISFLNPWADPAQSGYQLVQSLLAIGSGQLWGSGFGLSQQKLFYLPIQYTDFIFSVYAEEFGFVGCVALIGLLAVYASIALVVILRCAHPIYRLIAVGAVVLLVGQSLLNIGVAAGALPTTGLPFPFFSYGGSSMISSLLTAALLIRVARESGEAQKVIDLPTYQARRVRRSRAQGAGSTRQHLSP